MEPEREQPKPHVSVQAFGVDLVTMSLQKPPKGTVLYSTLIQSEPSQPNPTTHFSGRHMNQPRKVSPRVPVLELSALAIFP